MGDVILDDALCQHEAATRGRIFIGSDFQSPTCVYDNIRDAINSEHDVIDVFTNFGGDLVARFVGVFEKDASDESQLIGYRCVLS